MRKLLLTVRPGDFLVVLITAMLLFTGPLEAQGRRRGGGAQDPAALEQRVRAQMARMMSERLGLTDDQADRLSEVTQSFDGRRRELARAEQATRRRVEALMLEGGEDDAEALELLARMTELRGQEAALLGDEQAALLEILSPVQVLQMQSMRQQLGQRIRALRRGRGGEAGGMRRPGRRGGGAAAGFLSGRSPGYGFAPMWAPRQGDRGEH